MSKPEHSLPVVTILALLVIFCPLAIDIYLPAFPDIASALAVNEQKVQLTVAIFMLSVGLGQLIAGPLADKFGRRPIVLTGIILYGFAGILAY